MLLLNVGCGDDVKRGYINIDKNFKYNCFIKNGCCCLKIDLDKERLTNYFNKNSINKILCSHITEHVINEEQLINDCISILIKSGKIVFKNPTTLKPSVQHHKTGYHKNYFWGFSTLCKRGLQEKNVLIKNKSYYQLNEHKGIHYLIKNPLRNFYEWVGRQFFDEVVNEFTKR